MTVLSLLYVVATAVYATLAVRAGMTSPDRPRSSRLKALSVIDAAFLQLETPATPRHVGAVFIMDPPRDRRGDYAELLREHLRVRLGNCEVFTRRLAPMPLNLANPLWVEHGEVDLDYHIRDRRLRGPVTRRALDEQVARLHAKLLDRSLP